MMQDSDAPAFALQVPAEVCEVVLLRLRAGFRVA